MPEVTDPTDPAQRLHRAALDHLIAVSPEPLAEAVRRLGPSLTIRTMVEAIEWLQEPGVTGAEVGPWLEACASTT